jgi:hypothetical protein
VPLWVWESYKIIGIFLFGAACSQLTTDIAKYTIGRLRPHFFDICRPNIDCSLMENKHRYHESFICTNPHSDAYKLKEVRLSFLSGHSSFSAYTMVFLVVCCVLKFLADLLGLYCMAYFCRRRTNEKFFSISAVTPKAAFVSRPEIQRVFFPLIRKKLN